MADYQLSTAVNLPSTELTLDDPFKTTELTVTMPPPSEPVAPPPPPSIESAEGQAHLAEVAAAQQAIIDRVAAQEAATPKPPVATAPSEESIFDFDFSKYKLDLPATKCGPMVKCFTPSPSFVTTEQIVPSPKEVDEGIIASIMSALKLAATAPPAGQPDETGNLAPGIAAGAIRDILKGVGVTVALGAIGYQLAGWKGAIAGAFIWLAPNIVPAIMAKAEVERALGT